MDQWRPLPGKYSSTWPGALDGKIYVLGGTEVDEPNPVTPVDWARVYDPEADTWTDLAPLPAEDRGLMGAFAIVPRWPVRPGVLGPCK